MGLKLTNGFTAIENNIGIVFVKVSVQCRKSFKISGTFQGKQNSFKDA